MPPQKNRAIAATTFFLCLALAALQSQDSREPTPAFSSGTTMPACSSGSSR